MEIKTKGSIATFKPQVTTTTKNNDIDISDYNNIRETDL